jgi:hypothetical protein
MQFMKKLKQKISFKNIIIMLIIFYFLAIVSDVLDKYILRTVINFCK